MIWTLTGTPSQQAIARQAFDRILFPLYRLTIPGSPELGWADLNTAAAVRAVDVPRSHEEPHGEDRPDALTGVDGQGRRWTMGLIYTESGNIYIDTRLEADPEGAMAVIAAELAHAVDFFLPMTDKMRGEFLRLWGRGASWWETHDYSTEYFTLGGEAFMHEFVAAFTDLNFGDKSAFANDVGVEPRDVYRILGIKQTGLVPGPFVTYGKSKVYHRPGHYTKMGTLVTNLTAYRPCRVCRP